MVKRSKLFFLLLVLSITIAVKSGAQVQPAAEKVMIGGKKYLLYTVAKGDTPYSIIKAFKITPDQFESANPELRGSIAVGQKIKIPDQAVAPQSEKSAKVQSPQPDNFIYHSAKKKETTFSISKKYGITLDELHRYNPGLKDGLQTGEVLQIPKPSKQTSPSAQPSVHKVAKGETLYSIARKYNMSQEEILKANPQITSSISKGMSLKIPARQPAKSVAEPVREGFKEYKVENGDTFFSLKQQFGVSEEEIKKYNPQAKEGLKAGMVIQFPGKPHTTKESVQEEQPVKADKAGSKSSIAKASKGTKYNVGLFLPFGVAPGDSLKTSSRTSNFLGVYQGALLAVDQAQKEGIKVKLYVYDTWQDPAVVDRLVKNPEFLSLDLIIGPVYPETQKTISELSAKNHIPMVSPLSADEVYVSKNPYYFQANPAKKLRLTTTADYVARVFGKENIIVLSRNNGSQDSKMVTDRLRGLMSRNDALASNVHFYNIWSEGSGGLENLLKQDKPNIIVMAETSEVNVSTAMNRLNTLSKKYSVTLVGIQEYTRLQSVDVEYFHNISLRYLSPYFVDYSSAKVNDFIRVYRQEYGSEPSQYSFQGYDATTYFLKALDQANKPSNANGVSNAGLLQADYDFEKVSDFGGFMNRSFFVVEYSGSYDVKSVGKIEGRLGE